MIWKLYFIKHDKSCNYGFHVCSCLIYQAFFIMEPSIKIIRSANRKKTVSARLVNGVIEVRTPKNISDKELERIVNELKERIQKQQKKRQLNKSEDLESRAQELNKRYFNGELKFQKIEYVTNQQKRLGSCTTFNGTIRISDTVAQLPRWVSDYVLVHELAHLKIPNHSKEFWKLVNVYPLTERARGYLMALSVLDERKE